MGEAKSIIWAGFDVGKASFVAALDEATASERRKVTSLPCREFKRNQDEVKKFFRWTKEEFPEAEVRIVMETTGCYSQHLTGWISQLRPDVPVTIENAGSIHAFIQSLNLPHKTDRLDAQAIARFGTERQPKPTNRPSKTVLALKELTHTRAALVRAKVEFENRHNKVQRKFETAAPNLVWVSDFTSVYVKDAPYSIAVIIDLYARMIVACEVMANATAKRMIGLFDTAFEQRHRPDNLTFHSDQGTQYTAYTFRKHLRDLGVNQSFSNPGTPLDNAVAESFFSCMKREELSHNYYDTVDDLKRDVADYVVFFNNMRSHRKLGMLTPCEAEQQFELEKS